MSAADKAKDKMQAVKGKAKEAVGRSAGDPYLEADGRKDRVAGDLKQAGENVKDAVKPKRT